MDKLLLIIVVVLAVLAVAQVARIYGMAASLRNQREEEISDADNNLNANMLLGFIVAFFGFFIYLLVAYQDELLPQAASEHGAQIDQLFTVNWILVFIGFFVINFMLFYFSYRYARNKNRKALYLAHNNKLEFVWTIIPAVVLAALIIYGLQTWNNVMGAPKEDALQMEIYGQQFKWTARYAGNDGKLGAANYTVISTKNPLGLITKATIDNKVKALEEDISDDVTKLTGDEVFAVSKENSLKEGVERLKRQKAKLIDMKSSKSIDFFTAYDDKQVQGQLHLPVNRQVNFLFRSRDVIHSAYMPHFRVQMNCVPGMVTSFSMTPTITTDSMRTIEDDPSFNYVLLCNKVCGSSHYNMRMEIVVESEADFEKWLKGQDTFAKSLTAEGIEVEKEYQEGKPLAEVND